MNSESPASLSLTLGFCPLQSYQQFVRHNANGVPGVYIWGFCFEDGNGGARSFMPYYVGKHEKSVQQRMRAHHHGIRCGTHLIFSQTFFSDFTSDPLNLEAAIKDNRNIVYTCKTEVDGRVVDVPKSKLPINRRDELRSHIDFYLDNLYVTFVPIHAEVVPDKVMRKKLIEHVERLVKHDLVGRQYVMGSIPRPCDYGTFDLKFEANRTVLGHIFKGTKADLIQLT